VRWLCCHTASHSLHPGLVVYRPIRMEHTVKNSPHPAPEAEEVYRRWIQFLDDEFTRHQAPERRSEIVRDQLYQLFLGRPHGGKLNLTLTSELPGNVLNLSMDPENVTLEAEHFGDADPELFAKRKPLLWFWQMFDRSPIGTNHWLGMRFRAMLGRHIFARMGAGVKIYHGVDLTFGYNLSIEDGITIGKGAVIGSFARIYSHIHSAHDYAAVTLAPTVIGPAARIASHAIVLAGQHIAAGELVGSFPAERG